MKTNLIMKSGRKTEAKVRTKKSTQDDLQSTTKVEEKLKKSVYSVSTPRNYVSKSSTADIYAKKKPALAPKKVETNNESSMKDFLKSSNSSASRVSVKTSKQKTADVKTVPNTQKVSRRLTLSNVTVNSPVTKRRLHLATAKDSSVNDGKDKREANPSKDLPKHPSPGRQRTKTRTLEDDEVKILTPEVIDNNAAMQSLSRKLAAQPKAFYVDLEVKTKKVEAKQMSKSSEDEVSYEDDFESYESDFDSYHSESQSDGISTRSEGSREDCDQTDKLADNSESEEAHPKEIKDEEKMLDSGNFDLRDAQRSASRKPALMDLEFILERSEDGINDKKTSLTDEGFQEMSSSSAVSSLKIVHTEFLERPLFIDFTKSKENKRKRKMFDRLKQRAKDILSMVTLHEMSYSLFEMKPIPYDLYMATFGRKNYTQAATQTFEDGITTETQTDNIFHENKWTQFPVKFSSNDIIFKENIVEKKDTQEEAFIYNFDYLINHDKINTNFTVSEEYKCNPLKIFLEQKEGAGSDNILPEDVYKEKIKSNAFNVNKLRLFLKKSERKLSCILSLNAGGIGSLNLVKTSKVPFSKGYLSVSTRNVTDAKFNFLKYTKMIGVCISETKENLILTYHVKSSNKGTVAQYFNCLWDTSVARFDPIKILKATERVTTGRYRGNTNGIFVATLEDCTLHVWDLSEEPTWCRDVASVDREVTKVVEMDTSQMSDVEITREWNLRNSQVSYDEKPQNVMQVSAFTSSGININSIDSIDSIVGLEFVGDPGETSQHRGRKVVGQICTLQRQGMLIIWCIIQEKNNTHDVGKAYWSKVKLEKNQTVRLSEHVDVPFHDTHQAFNLNAAKRRLSSKKRERIDRRREINRPSSSILKKSEGLVVGGNLNGWDSGVFCNHLKVLRLNKANSFLVAGGNGQVLCCKRGWRDFEIDPLNVAADKSSITRLEVTHSNLPYFLAATDSGNINLCSILEARVLLTLDCRNGPPSTTVRCHADHKGRFIASVPELSTNANATPRFNSNLSVRRLGWSPTNPFCILAVLASGAVVTWELTHSDINATSVLECDAIEATFSRCSSMALLTSDGEAQIHKTGGDAADSSVELFNKYVALL